MDLNPTSTLIQRSDEVMVDIIQHFAVGLEPIEYPLVWVLQDQFGKIAGNNGPAGGAAAVMRGAEEYDEPASLPTGLGVVDGVLDNDAAEAVGDEQDRVPVISEYLSLDLDQQIAAVLRDVVLIAGLKDTAGYIGIVPIGPYPCLGEVIGEEVVGPKDG
jgi:hypothetical protein